MSIKNYSAGSPIIKANDLESLENIAAKIGNANNALSNLDGRIDTIAVQLRDEFPDLYDILRDVDHVVTKETRLTECQNYLLDTVRVLKAAEQQVRKLFEVDSI